MCRSGEGAYLCISKAQKRGGSTLGEPWHCPALRSVAQRRGLGDVDAASLRARKHVLMSGRTNAQNAVLAEDYGKLPLALRQCMSLRVFMHMNGKFRRPVLKQVEKCNGCEAKLRRIGERVTRVVVVPVGPVNSVQAHTPRGTIRHMQGNGLATFTAARVVSAAA